MSADPDDKVVPIVFGIERDPNRWPEDAKLFLRDRAIEPETARAQGWAFAVQDLIRKKLRFDEGKGVPSKGITMPIITLDGADDRWLVKVLDKRWRAKYLFPEGADTQRLMLQLTGLKSDYAKMETRFYCESLVKMISLSQNLDQKREVAFGLNGCGGAFNGGKLIADITAMGGKIKGRDIILFDSDWADPDKFQVRQNTIRTADALAALGRDVGIVLLPTLPRHEKTGVDDYLAHADGGYERLRALKVYSPDDPMFADWRVHPAVALLNKRHAVVTIGSTTVVMRTDTVNGEVEVLFQKQKDFELWYSNQRHVVGKRDNGAPIEKTAAQIWLESPHRIQYERVTLDPSAAPGANPGFYNLWRGFRYASEAEQAKATTWELFRAFIHDVICSGDDKHAAWVEAWMARCVQRPWEPAGVSLVLNGRQGVGKTRFATTFGALYGEAHFRTIHQQQHAVGRFNAIIRDAILVFCDEAFFASDPKIKGPLKGMITADRIVVEHKNIDPLVLPNMRAYILASNEHRVVPAELDARRWAVFHVSDEHANDRKYFGEIVEQMESGGYAAMLRDLLALKIGKKIDPYRAPATDALIEQKELSLRPEEQFWYECVKRGEYPARLEVNVFTGTGVSVKFDPWPSTTAIDVPRKVAMQAYLERLKEYREHTSEMRAHATTLGIAVRKLFPTCTDRRLSTPDGRDWAWTLPGLTGARLAVAEVFGGAIEWE